MVMRTFLLRISCLALLWLFSTIAVAANPTKSTKQWFAEFTTNNIVEGTFVHRIAFVTGFKNGKPQPIKLDANEFEDDSFFELIDTREIELTRLFNAKATPPSPPRKGFKDINSFVTELFASTTADTLIYAPHRERWVIYFKQPGKGIEKLMADGGPKSKKPDALKRWLIGMLGYAGIVLDQQDNRLLVAIYKPVKDKDKILLVYDNVRKLLVRHVKPSGVGQLKKVECYNSICSFDAPTDTISRFEMGDKITF